MSGRWPKAPVLGCPPNGRFQGESGHEASRTQRRIYECTPWSTAFVYFTISTKPQTIRVRLTIGLKIRSSSSS
jgi:hypothetical protein